MAQSTAHEHDSAYMLHALGHLQGLARRAGASGRRASRWYSAHSLAACDMHSRLR